VNRASGSIVKGMPRLLLGATFLLLMAAPAGAVTPLATYKVPRGAFTIRLPSSWVDLTVPSKALSSGSPATIAKYVDANGPLKLIAADPATAGRVFLKVRVERVGPTDAKTITKVTVDAARKNVGKAGKVTSTPVSLGAGKGYVIHLTEAGSGGQTGGLIYVLVKDQVLYALTFSAPGEMWAKYSPLFDQIARTFRFTPGPDLGHLILKPTQVGTGYKRTVIDQGGSFIGEGTIDLCGATYPSESLRTGRLQVRYSHTGKTVTLSNEIATYSSQGAAEAMREVSAEAKACAAKPVVRKQGSLTTTFKVDPLSDPKLLPGTVAVHLTVSASDGKKKVSEDWIVIYQRNGETISGVYALATKGTTLAAAKRIGLHAAEQSAHVLAGSLFTA
jgi:hypothetical protein